MRPVDNFHSVLPVSLSNEVACLLHWLQHNISLVSGSFCHMSHRLDKQFLASFQLCYCFFVVVVVIVNRVDVAVWVRVFGVTVFNSRIILSIFSLFSLFFQQATLISVMSWFFYSAGTLVWVCQNYCL